PKANSKMERLEASSRIYKMAVSSFSIEGKCFIVCLLLRNLLEQKQELLCYIVPITRWCRLRAEKLSDWRPWLTTGFVVVSIAAYTVLSGAGPAAIRSGIMGILMVIAPLLGRVYYVYAALALAALGM